MHGNTVSLIGLGLLGGSLGKAMLQGGLAKRVLGLVRREESIQQAQEAGIVHQAYLEPQEAVQEADLIILCTPVLKIPALMEKLNETDPTLGQPSGQQAIGGEGAGLFGIVSIELEGGLTLTA